MAVSFRVQLNSPGIRSLLSSPATQTMVETVAGEVAARAAGQGVMVEGDPGTVPVPITVTPAGTAGRARAWVVLDHPSGVAVEAKHRLLVGSLGGPGGGGDLVEYTTRSGVTRMATRAQAEAWAASRTS